jgi:arabinose-5-phosphate isomerase
MKALENQGLRPRAATRRVDGVGGAAHIVDKTRGKGTKLASTPLPKGSPKPEDLAEALRVLEIEIEGMRALARVLDDRFVRVLDILSATRGRVVVTGMGKSGHIAHKIAATLASTGTPALYVHPAEASHGDLGMITATDSVIALSNSGETPELSDIVAHTRRHNIPLIAITGREGSALARAADAALVLPSIREACPLELAPTTSTTAMLVIGDVIAMALLKRQGFSEEKFQALHPGGQLGRRFIKVADIMHAGEELPLARIDSSMADALVTMTAKSFGCVGIVDGDGRLAGIITDGDLRRHMDSSLIGRKAGEVMTARPRSIAPDDLAATALRIMNENKITSLFVVEDGRARGILHIHDCLRAGIA